MSTMVLTALGLECSGRLEGSYVKQESRTTKMERACAPPPGLKAPPGLGAPSQGRSIQQTSPTPVEYTIDEEVLTLRSDGSWSAGTIKEIRHDKVIVALKDGVKNIRKEKMITFLRKVEVSQKKAMLPNGCVSRQPIVGDRVKSLVGEVTLEDAVGEEDAWKLLLGEFAVVSAVDLVGDFRLLNRHGLESCICYRKDFEYMETEKHVANAPWRSAKKAAEVSKATEESNHTISRDEFLSARVSLAARVEERSGQYGLRTATVDQCTAQGKVVVEKHSDKDELCAPPPGLECAPPPGLEKDELCAPPPGLEKDEQSEDLDSSVSTMASEDASLPQDEPASDSAILEEYQVLLENLPKALLKVNMLRAMVKEAKLKNVKRLAFSSDGKALITLTSYASLCRCIAHFHGFSWFQAAMYNVPSIVATHVQVKSSMSSAQAVAPQQAASNLFADAPVFVPGATQFTADVPVFVPGAMQLTSNIAAAYKIGERSRCTSRASTHSGSSSDEASCGSDSEMEAQLVCA